MSSLAKVAAQCPGLIANLRYFKKFHRFGNFKGDVDTMSLFVDYVFRVMLENGGNQRWALRADKYAVRAEVASIVGDKYLIPLYGHWDNPEDIDFDSLPDSFVLKTNNGCGTNIIVHDKSTLDRKAAVKQLKKSLEFPYPQFTGQLHYSLIKPCVIAEKLMVEKGHKSLTDYKFYCVNGEPVRIYTFMERDEVHHFDFKVMAFDPQWNEHPEALTEKYRAPEGAIKAPAQLGEMMDIARKLSADDEFVRVDLYLIDGRIYFGELTYTPDSAFAAAFVANGMNPMLDKIKADRRAGKTRG